MLLDRIVAGLSEMTNVKPHSTHAWHVCFWVWKKYGTCLEHEGMDILLAVCLTIASLQSHFFLCQKVDTV